MAAFVVVAFAYLAGAPISADADRVGKERWYSVPLESGETSGGYLWGVGAKGPKDKPMGEICTQVGMIEPPQPDKSYVESSGGSLCGHLRSPKEALIDATGFGEGASRVTVLEAIYRPAVRRVVIVLDSGERRVYLPRVPKLSNRASRGIPVFRYIADTFEGEGCARRVTTFDGSGAVISNQTKSDCPGGEPLLPLFGNGASAAEASGSDKGQVGGPPTIALGPPDEGKQTSPELVIGRGRTSGGPAEIVAYGWEAEEDAGPDYFCVWVEQLPDEILFGACEVAPQRPGSIGMEMKIKAIWPKSARATYVGGLVSLDVASVRISFRRPGSDRRFRANPILGWVRGVLQQRLGQPAPFGFYYAKVIGHVKFSQVRAEALNAEGEVIGKVGA
jgi:hypothetical protein